MWYWHWDRQNRSIKQNTVHKSIYAYTVIFDEGMKAMQWEKESDPTPSTKRHSKWIIDLSVKPKITVKFLEKNNETTGMTVQCFRPVSQEENEYLFTDWEYIKNSNNSIIKLKRMLTIHQQGDAKSHQISTGF